MKNKSTFATAVKTTSILVFFLVQNVFAQQSTATEQVTTFTIDAPQLSGSKKIWVYLPKNYEASSKKYPVLYMHDAQNLFDAKTSFSGEWNVDESLDSLNAQVIVIGIEHGNDKRIDELTPFKNPKYGGGNADAYLDFIRQTLKPEVDKKYRTKTAAKDTAIMGSSLGGLVSYYAVLKYPEVFGKAAIFSPSFWYSNEIYKLTENTKKIKTKIYFLCGDNESDEMVPDMQNMIKLVREKKNASPKFTTAFIIKGGQHSEKLWREHFVNAYLWLFLVSKFLSF